MEYIKFNSLENTYREASLHRFELAGLTANSEKWFVTEKVHGANFGIYCNGFEVKAASRNGFVKEGDKFYDYKRILEKYKEAAINESRDLLNRTLPSLFLWSGFALHGTPYTIIFGELFGGSIHKNVPYPKEQDFLVFDFCTVLDIENLDAVEKIFKNKSGNGKYFRVEENKIILAPSGKLEMFASLNESGFRTVPVLFEGTFEECMKISNDFESKLVDIYYVNSLHLSEEQRELRCKAEGIVIEPDTSIYVGEMRAYFKNRSPKFEEKKKEPRPDVTQMIKDTLSPKAVFVIEKLDELICENRLESVLSKTGEFTMRDFNRVAKEFLEDMIESFEKDELYDVDEDRAGDLSTYLSKVEFKAVSKIVYHNVTQFIKPVLLKM